MKMGWRISGLCTALAALALMASAPAASAQDVDGDCRCVDADGNAIDNCTCFVIPDIDFELSDLPDMPQVMAFGPGGGYTMAFRSARPRLGVSVSTDQDDSYDGQGARVSSVMEDGPADEAGIREGDIITSVDGRSLFTPLEDDLEEDIDLEESVPVQRLLAIARELEPGASVEVEYLRDGQPMTATVEVQDLARIWGRWADDFNMEFRPRMERFQQELRPRLDEIRERVRESVRERQDVDVRVNGLRDLGERQRVVIGRRGNTARYGLSLTDLTPGLADYFGAEQGALVTDVDEDTTLGLEAGDVILRIGDREVTSPSRAARILSSYDDEESVTFRVLRDGSEMDVMGRLGG